MVTTNFLILSSLTLGILGLIFGVLLGYASKKCEVHVDPRVTQIRQALPGVNCGGCGYVGCDAYAEAVAAGEAKVNLCVAGGNTVTAAIAAVMGVAAGETERKVAFVQCGGSPDKAVWKYDYFGVRDCRKAVITPGGGPKACEYGCLGFGTCVEVCQFDAMHIVEGIAVVDEDACVGCGLCVEICPKNIIEIRKISEAPRVACSSPERGKDVRQVCEVGCIGCGLCAKVCPAEAMVMENNLPVVDQKNAPNALSAWKNAPPGLLFGSLHSSRCRHNHGLW